METKEQKRDRFQRMAPKRVNAVLDKLRLVGNCASRRSYEYTEEEVNKIFSEIEDRVAEVKARFRFSEKKNIKPKFEL